MKIKFIVIGKTQESFVEEGFDMYRKRIIHYIPFETVTLPALKNTRNLTDIDFKRNEGELLLKSISPDDFAVLLDERGKSLDSQGFSEFIQARLNAATKNLLFIIGGAYGFSEEVYKRADYQLSLSPMTFSHQVVRILFMEQLYRAFTILRNEPYHK